MLKQLGESVPNDLEADRSSHFATGYCLVDGMYAAGRVLGERDEYRRLLERSVDGMCQTTPPGRPTFVDTAFAILLGYDSPNRMLAEVGLVQHDLYVDGRERRQLTEALDRDNEIRDAHTRLRRRDGKVVWVSLNACTVRDDAGRVQSYLCTVRDITASKIAGKEADEREDRYHGVVEAAGTAIVFMDTHGIVREWNPAAARITAFGWSQAVGRHFADLLGGDEGRAKLQNQIDAWLHSHNTRDQEITVIRRDGEPRLLQWNTSAHIDAGGVFRGIIGVGQDITDRKGIESALRRAEQNYRGLFENATYGIFQAGLDGRITLANPALATILGFPSVQALLESGVTTSRLVSDPVAHDEFMASLARGDAVSRLEQPAYRHDGREIWLSVSARRVEGEDGSRMEGIIVDISERKHAARQLEYLAHNDSLTGIPNRHAFESSLRRFTDRVRERTLGGFALLVINVDCFKEINDTRGHHVGDALLGEVGERLSDWLHEDEVLARIGGDEFGLLLPGPADTREIDRACDDIRTLIAGIRRVRDHDLTVTASIGVTRFPGDVVDAGDRNADRTLLQNVDLALYWCKRDGRDRHRYFTADMQKELRERKSLEEDLVDAIAADRLEVYFQPVVRLGDGALQGAEALIRWPHPARGLIPPADFIPLAERTGLIRELGRRVLVTACDTVARWNRESDAPPLSVSVNLSAQELTHETIVEQIEEALDRSGLAARCLNLEITESTMIRSPERVRRLLSDMRGWGIRVAIDDFGTGYSSLAYLKDLPVDILKIDRSFIASIADTECNAAIVKAVVDLGHSLALDITAEGIETDAQREHLDRQGVNTAQGFMIGRPMTGYEFEMWRLRHQASPAPST